MTRLLTTLTLGLALAVLPACSGDDETPAAAQAPTSAPPSSSDVAAPAATAEPVLGTLAPEGIGISGMVLTTPAEGNGPRPELSWEPVDGARYYTVVVSTEDGQAYWAWEGEVTSVPLGGHPRLEDHAAGPRLAPGMRWTVAARNADHHVIAVSARQALEP